MNLSGWEMQVSDDVHDGLLVVRCRLGEREAFRELVGAWRGPLCRYLRGMVGSPHLADDLAQEVWIAVMRGLPRLRQPERFAPGLFSIARRTVTSARASPDLCAAFAVPLPDRVPPLRYWTPPSRRRQVTATGQEPYRPTDQAGPGARAGQAPSRRNR